MNTQSEIPQTAQQRGKISPTKLAHIVYKTSNYEEMVSWYKTVLEAEVMAASPFITFLTYDDEHHRIAIAAMPGLEAKPAQACGVEHCAFTYASIDDLILTYERLQALDIMPYWTINHGPTLSMYYRDPDQNQVELQIDIYDNNEAINKWFEQSDFDTNPIGVKFEPADIFSRYRSGEDLETVLARPRIDPAELFNQFPPPPEA